MFGISYWVVPIFSSLVWLSMLLALLLDWVVSGSPILPSMEPGQHIAYISDTGAFDLKPLFIAMSAVTVVSFDLVFIFERWLRHTGRLTRNTSWVQKGLSILAIIAAIGGAAGLILLSVFDTYRHPQLHDDFLILFIVGYVVSAIVVCAEYQRLGIHYREHRILRISFWIKLMFIIIEVALAIAFGVMNRQNHWNRAAILEWVIALVYFFYVLSYFMDFLPATHSKHHQSRENNMEMAMNEDSAVAETSAAQMDGDGGRYYGNGATNNYGASDGYSNANGYTNGHAHFGNGIRNHKVGPEGDTYLPDGHEQVPPSRNF